MSDYVPEDLMIKIFTRLPIKSILRCTSVCKSWYSLLTSPNFIFTHLNRKQDDHILIQNYVGNSEIYIYALSRYNEKLDQNNHLDYSFKCSNGVVTIVGSCNGIVCIAAADQLNYLNHFYFWNPAIRKPVELPDLGYTCEKCDTFAYALGFGYDHVTNDYKVVRVVHTWSHPSPPHVDLYKLSTGVWEDISHVSLSYLFLATTSQAYVNGASHWIASKWDVSSLVSVIVLFNMHDETFSEMILPSSLINESRSFYDEMFLFVSEESLCLVDNNYDKRKPIDIWMMKEYGAPDSWVKQFSIQNNQFAQHIPLRDDIFWTPYSGNAAPTDFEIANEFLKPMAIRKNGEILWEGNRRLLVSVDHTGERFKDADVGNLSNDWCYNPRYVSYYKESLVLPDRWTNNCVGDACEESSDLWKRDPKDGKKRISRAKSNIESGVHLFLT